MFDLMAIHSFLPVPNHIVKDHPNWAEDAGAKFVSNGPFKLTSWRHHNQLEMEKNDRYWDKNVVRIEKIDLSIIADEMTELNMFESGQLEWAGNPLSSIPIDAYQALRTRLNIYPLAGVYYYVFNVKEAPFNNVNLRKAFAYAINRKEIIENITQMGQSVATAAVPPIISKENVSFFKDNDWKEAKRLFKIALREMHLTKETFPPIVLSYNTSSAHHRIAQAIAEQWKAAFGIKIELKNMEWKVFLDELTHKQFQVARLGEIASYNDSIAFLDSFRYADSTHNYSGWTNDAFTALLNEADATVDESRRKELLNEAEKIFVSEMPIAPIYFYTGSYLQKPYLKNVVISEFCEIDLKHAYLEKN
jgi:oligopeptide transport system substrate-binding protein